MLYDWIFFFYAFYSSGRAGFSCVTRGPARFITVNLSLYYCNILNARRFPKVSNIYHARYEIIIAFRPRDLKTQKSLLSSSVSSVLPFFVYCTTGYYSPSNIGYYRYFFFFLISSRCVVYAGVFRFGNLVLVFARYLEKCDISVRWSSTLFQNKKNVKISIVISIDIALIVFLFISGLLGLLGGGGGHNSITTITLPN